MTDASMIETQWYAESTVEEHIIVECPGCDDSMRLGQMWRESIGDGHDVPKCPDCEPGE